MSIAERYAAVRQRIAEACARAGRSPASVVLVAVSKSRPPDDVAALYALGHRDFGESYPQELLDKAARLPGDIRWHFIGRLQKNKARGVAQIPNLESLQSIDRESLATAVNDARASMSPAGAPLRRLNVLVQVNTSREATKGGVAPDALPELAGRLTRLCPALNMCGLMTIGEPGCAQRDFALLRSLCPGPAERQSDWMLSMGMTDDFELAIEMGSTCVRVGRAIFGDR